jgi:UPF0716 protein FxsA
MIIRFKNFGIAYLIVEILFALILSSFIDWGTIILADFAASVLGVVILTRVPRDMLSPQNLQMSGFQGLGQQLGAKTLAIFSGILLFVPGLLTDTLGILLFMASLALKSRAGGVDARAWNTQNWQQNDEQPYSSNTETHRSNAQTPPNAPQPKSKPGATIEGDFKRVDKE